MLVTVDVEDHAPEGQERRFREALAPLLDGLRDRQVRATFFVVGSIAAEFADELRELAAEGHEVGLHGHTHRHLVELGPVGFADDLARGKDALAEVLGSEPIGFRAPYFSLTRDTPWAPEVLAAHGIVYSSSVLPAWNPQAGFPRAPRTPFLWPSGVVEFPVPVFGVGPLALPVLGGAYLRLLPRPAVAIAAALARRRPLQWTYAHPYDFDTDEAFHRRPVQSWLVAKLLFARRSLMLGRVMGLADSAARPLGEHASDAAFRSGLLAPT